MRIHETQLDKLDRLPMHLGMHKNIEIQRNFCPNYYRRGGVNWNMLTSILKSSIGKSRKTIIKSLNNKIRNLGEYSVVQLIGFYVDEIKYINGIKYFVDNCGRLKETKRAWTKLDSLYFENDVLNSVKLQHKLCKSSCWHRDLTSEELFIGDDDVLKNVLNKDKFCFNRLGFSFKYISVKKSSGCRTELDRYQHYGTKREYLIFSLKQRRLDLGEAKTKFEYKNIKEAIAKYEYILKFNYEKILY